MEKIPPLSDLGNRYLLTSYGVIAIYRRFQSIKGQKVSSKNTLTDNVNDNRFNLCFCLHYQWGTIY